MSYTPEEAWAIIQRRQEAIIAAGITNPDDLSWGDTILNLASALILVMNSAAGLAPGDSRTLKAIATLFHNDTITELLRLSEILNATEGFESKNTVQINEARDGAIEDADEVRAAFNKLMGLDSTE